MELLTCGDVETSSGVNDSGVIEDASLKLLVVDQPWLRVPLYGEWVKGKSVDEASEIKNTQIANHLALPPVKIHCSVL